MPEFVNVTYVGFLFFLSRYYNRLSYKNHLNRMERNLENVIRRALASGHQKTAEGMPFPRRLNRSTISANLKLIWEMSD